MKVGPSSPHPHIYNISGNSKPRLSSKAIKKTINPPRASASLKGRVSGEVPGTARKTAQKTASMALHQLYRS